MGFKLDAVVGGLLSQMEGRADANETATFTRQLEHIFKKTYDVQYPEYKGRSLVPVNTEVPAGAESHTYRQMDWRGEAAIVRDPSDDFPNVDVLGAEFTQKIVSLGDSYRYSVQDLRNAAMAGIQLDAMRAAAARRAMETKLDALICTGNTAAGLYGFANHPNIQDLSVGGSDPIPNGDWLNSSTTVADILADINWMQNKIFSATKGIYMPDTLVLGTKTFAKLSTEAQSPTFTEQSILKYVLSQSPWLRSIEFWPRLDTADTGGTKERIMMYARNPEVAQAFIPQEFEQLAPQARNMAFVVPCHMRFGGVVVRYPLAVAFADGAEA